MIKVHGDYTKYIDESMVDSIAHWLDGHKDAEEIKVLVDMEDVYSAKALYKDKSVEEITIMEED